MSTLPQTNAPSPEVAAPAGSAELSRGIVVAIPAGTPARPTELPTQAETRPWVDALERLTSDPAELVQHAEGVRSAMAGRTPACLVDLYASYFERPTGSQRLFVAASHRAP